MEEAEQDEHLSFLNEIRQGESVTFEYNSAKYKETKLINQRRRLIDQRDLLQKRLEEAQSKLAKTQDRGEIFNYGFQTSEQIATEDTRPSFFKILRALEADYEQHYNERDGLASEVKGLKSSVSELMALRKRQVRQLEQLRDQKSDAESRTRRIMSDLRIKSERLRSLDNKTYDMEEECNGLKLGMKSLSEEMKTFTEDDMAELELQKQLLEQSISEKKLELESLKKDQARLRSRINITRKRCDRSMKQASSPAVWMSERISLIGKIKKAKNDLSQLENRDRGNTRLAETYDRKIQELNCTEGEIKACICAELSSIQTELSPFQKDALDLEQEYGKELEEKLRETNDSLSLVEKYHNSVMTLLKQQEAVVAKGDRIQALSSELATTRADL